METTERFIEIKLCFAVGLIAMLAIIGGLLYLKCSDSSEYRINLIDQTTVEITTAEGAFFVHPDSIQSFIDNDNL